MVTSRSAFTLVELLVAVLLMGGALYTCGIAPQRNAWQTVKSLHGAIRPGMTRGEALSALVRSPAEGGEILAGMQAGAEPFTPKARTEPGWDSLGIHMKGNTCSVILSGYTQAGPPERRGEWFLGTQLRRDFDSREACAAFLAAEGIHMTQISEIRVKKQGGWIYRAFFYVEFDRAGKMSKLGDMLSLD